MKDDWWLIFLLAVAIALSAVAAGFLIGAYLVLNDLVISWG